MVSRFVLSHQPIQGRCPPPWGARHLLPGPQAAGQHQLLPHLHGPLVGQPGHQPGPAPVAAQHHRQVIAHRYPDQAGHRTIQQLFPCRMQRQIQLCQLLGVMASLETRRGHRKMTLSIDQQAAGGQGVIEQIGTAQILHASQLTGGGSKFQLQQQGRVLGLQGLQLQLFGQGGGRGLQVDEVVETPDLQLLQSLEPLVPQGGKQQVVVEIGAGDPAHGRRGLLQGLAQQGRGQVKPGIGAVADLQKIETPAAAAPVGGSGEKKTHRLIMGI